jgi:hypothetical protein
MRKKLLLGVVALVASAVATFACVGDDPVASNPTVDGGGGSETSNTTDSGGGDGGTAIAIVDVSSGDHFACAVRADGSVVCWGTNAFGEAGQPAAGGEQCDGTPCRLPSVVAGITDAAKIASGSHQSCVATKAGKVLCWGANDDGVLGHPPSQDTDCGGGKKCNEKPTEVANVSGAIGVAVESGAIRQSADAFATVNMVGTRSYQSVLELTV